MRPEQIAQYLMMLGVPSVQPVSLQFLAQLQKKHIESFGWDTLDLFLGREIDLTPENIVRKFEVESRGGVCYELNGAFCELLRHLGFDAYLASAYVHGYNENVFNFVIDTHAVIVVKLQGADYLVDVGWGDSYRVPVQIKNNLNFADQSGRYRLKYLEDSGECLMEKCLAGKWVPQYRFEKKEFQLDQFYQNLNIVYVSPAHGLHRQINCVKPTARGCLSLNKEQLQIKENGTIQDVSIDDQDAIAACLKNKFNMSEEFVNTYFSTR